MQKATSFNDVAIVNVKGSSCRIHFWYIRKDDAISIMKKSKLVDKKVFSIFLSMYKMWLDSILLKVILLIHIISKENEMWYYIEQKNTMKMIKKD